MAVVFLTSGELGLKHLPTEEAWRIRECEAAAAAEVLGVSVLNFLRRPDWYAGDGLEEAAAALRPILERERPERIYLPHPGEWHPDHQASLPILTKALEGYQEPVPALRMYEVWTPLAEYDDVEDVTSTMTQKLRAVRCYRCQLAFLRYDRAVRGLNQYRGVLAAACPYAEVFLCGSVGLQDAGKLTDGSDGITCAKVTS